MAFPTASLCFIFPVGPQDGGPRQSHASDYLSPSPHFSVPGSNLFHGSLEELHLPQAPLGKVQAMSEEPPPLPPKICRSVSVSNLRTSLLKPLQEGPSGRSLSQGDLLTEAIDNMVSHSSFLRMVGQQIFTVGPCFRHNSEQDRQNPCP